MFTASRIPCISFDITFFESSADFIGMPFKIESFKFLHTLRYRAKLLSRASLLFTVHYFNAVQMCITRSRTDSLVKWLAVSKHQNSFMAEKAQLGLPDKRAGRGRGSGCGYLAPAPAPLPGCRVSYSCTSFFMWASFSCRYWKLERASWYTTSFLFFSYS